MQTVNEAVAELRRRRNSLPTRVRMQGGVLRGLIM